MIIRLEDSEQIRLIEVKNVEAFNLIKWTNSRHYSRVVKIENFKNIAQQQFVLQQRNIMSQTLLKLRGRCKETHNKITIGLRISSVNHNWFDKVMLDYKRLMKEKQLLRIKEKSSRIKTKPIGFPSEVIVTIINFLPLDLKSWYNASHVCSSWYKHLSKQNLWKELYDKRWIANDNSTIVDYKREVIRRYNEDCRRMNLCFYFLNLGHVYKQRVSISSKLNISWIHPNYELYLTNLKTWYCKFSNKEYIVSSNNNRYIHNNNIINSDLELRFQGASGSNEVIELTNIVQRKIFQMVLDGVFNENPLALSKIIHSFSPYHEQCKWRNIEHRTQKADDKAIVFSAHMRFMDLSTMLNLMKKVQSHYTVTITITPDKILWKQQYLGNYVVYSGIHTVPKEIVLDCN
jgi:hypothetical protein